MGETFLFNIAERVLDKIVDLSVEEVRLAFNVKTDLGKLKESMSSIKAVLLDAERQQHQNGKLRLCMWKLRDIFYDAEDVIDDFRCEALRKQIVHHPSIGFKMDRAKRFVKINGWLVSKSPLRGLFDFVYQMGVS
ncbi:hypothetical protein V6N13_131465 [Hibiscus sabdariffa]